jgi:hypothetical protein
MKAQLASGDTGALASGAPSVADATSESDAPGA